jgi:hypothetical protein
MLANIMPINTAFVVPILFRKSFKAAYAFTVGLLTTNTYMPMAATMAGGMVPAIGMALI